MINKAVLIGMNSCQSKGFDKDKVSLFRKAFWIWDLEFLLCVLWLWNEEIKQKFVYKEYKKKYLQSNRLEMHINYYTLL